MKRTFAFAAALALSAAFTPLPSLAQPGINVYVTTAPPAPLAEYIPPPRMGQTWVPGYWDWNGGRHVWMAGHWEAVRIGYGYKRAEWSRDTNGWRLNRGGWQEAGSAVHSATDAAVQARAQAAHESNMISMAPPQARYERVPSARSGSIWVPGFWDWRGNRHEWVAGHWEANRNGYQYQRPEWVRDDNNWRLNRGGWQEAAARAQVRSATNAAIRAGERAAYESSMIGVAPPQARYERMPSSRSGYVWVPGFWEWRGNRHEWVAGAWVRDRRGFVYSQPRWMEQNGQWYMQQGRWVDAGRGNDGDRDGVPDAADNDRDNDGVPNGSDIDRDGDGYRNSGDRFPDDPRRR